MSTKTKRSIHADAAKVSKVGKVGKIGPAKGKVAKAANVTPKANKPAKAPKAEGTARRGRAPAWPLDAKIKVLAKTNPKREGTNAFEKFERYSRVKTVGEFLADGGASHTLHYDIAHNFIEIG